MISAEPAREGGRRATHSNTDVFRRMDCCDGGTGGRGWVSGSTWADAGGGDWQERDGVVSGGSFTHLMTYARACLLTYSLTYYLRYGTRRSARGSRTTYRTWAWRSARPHRTGSRCARHLPYIAGVGVARDLRPSLYGRCASTKSSSTASRR